MDETRRKLYMKTLKLKMYCKAYELIENYNDALKDNFVGWQLHHRMETHTYDGYIRPVFLTVNELKALDMYYGRPPEELIFMRTSDHASLHMKRRKVSDETRKKMSDNHNYSARHNHKYVICIETEEVFLSGAQLAEKLGVCKQFISRRILDGNPIRGFHYVYKK